MKSEALALPALSRQSPEDRWRTTPRSTTSPRTRGGRRAKSGVVARRSVSEGRDGGDGTDTGSPVIIRQRAKVSSAAAAPT